MAIRSCLRGSRLSWVLRTNQLSRHLTDLSSSVVPKPTLSVVWEDANYFMVDKPAGAVVAGEAKGVTSFHDLVKSHAAQHNFEHPNLLHRLDKGTSGLMVFPKTTAAAKHFLKLQEQEGAIAKEYLAVVAGELPSQEGEIKGNIIRSKDKLTFTVVQNPKSGKPVHTFYRRLQSAASAAIEAPSSTAPKQVDENFTQSKAQPKHSIFSGVAMRLNTGRKHQLRASLRTLGCSILGDKRYGGPKFNASKYGGVANSTAIGSGKRTEEMLLHAHRISFEGPVLEKGVPAVRYDVACAPPQSWGRLAELVASEGGELEAWRYKLDEEAARLGKRLPPVRPADSVIA